MNTRYLLIAGLTGAVVTTALANIPIVNLVNLALCVGFWGGPVLAAWMYRRAAGSMTLGQGVIVGVVTGALAGLMGFVLGFFDLAGAGMLLRDLRPFLPAEDLAEAGLTGLAAVVFNLIGASVNVVFGAIGGLIGGALFRSRPQAA